MPTINVDQGSLAWLQLRQAHITATDISVIMQSNPFSTELELWESKLGMKEPISMNAAMERGQRLEPEARELANKIKFCSFDPVVIVSDEHHWAMASLDGYHECESNKKFPEVCKLILEIKCPKESTHIEAIEGHIPAYYMDQIQWQLMVAEADICYYFSYRPEYKSAPYAIIDIMANKERQTEMIEKGYEFYRKLCSFEAPKTWTIRLKKSF